MLEEVIIFSVIPIIFLVLAFKTKSDILHFFFTMLALLTMLLLLVQPVSNSNTIQSVNTTNVYANYTFNETTYNSTLGVSSVQTVTIPVLVNSYQNYSYVNETSSFSNSNATMLVVLEGVITLLFLYYLLNFLIKVFDFFQNQKMKNKEDML